MMFMKISPLCRIKPFKKGEFSYDGNPGSLKIVDQRNETNFMTVEFEGALILLSIDNIAYLAFKGTFDKGVYSENVVLVKDGQIIKALPVSSEEAYKLATIEKKKSDVLIPNQNYLLSNKDLKQKELLYLGEYYRQDIEEWPINDNSYQELVGSQYFTYKRSKKMHYFYDLDENQISSFILKDFFAELTGTKKGNIENIPLFLSERYKQRYSEQPYFYFFFENEEDEFFKRDLLTKFNLVTENKIYK